MGHLYHGYVKKPEGNMPMSGSFPFRSLRYRYLQGGTGKSIQQLISPFNALFIVDFGLMTAGYILW